MKLAVPSVGEGGLDAQRSAHFGHADCFTVVTIENGEIVAAGMGMRPMQGFASAGITVLHDAETPLVGDVARRAAAGELSAMGPEHACHH